jgi:hypothetical protein
MRQPNPENREEQNEPIGALAAARDRQRSELIVGDMCS